MALLSLPQVVLDQFANRSTVLVAVVALVCYLQLLTKD